MPERTLLALADAGMPAGGMFSQTEDPRLTLEEFKLAGIDTDELAGQLQREGGDSFKTSWYGLLDGLDKKLERFAASDNAR
jgi:transaldolase